MNFSTYLISLPTALKRRSASIQELNKVFKPHEYTVVDGVPASQFINFNVDTEEWLVDYRHPEVKALESLFCLPIDQIVNETALRAAIDPWILENPGGVGCTLAHAKVFRRFSRQSKADNLVIFEDDFRIQADSSRLELENIINCVPKDRAAVVLLYSWAKTQKVYELSSKKTVSGCRSMYRLLNNELYFKNMEYVDFEQSHRVCSTAAYILNRPAVTNLLGAVFPVRFSADWFHFFWEWGLIDELWGVEPVFASLRNSSSQTASVKLSKRVRSRAHPFHEAGEYCVRNKVPILGSIVNLRRRLKYGTSAGQRVKFV